MSEYIVKSLINKVIHIDVPGSKSITNRALLIAALGTGTSFIKGALKSEDSEHFLESLRQLGFNIKELNDKIIIDGCEGNIPNKKAEIYVGSAGTAARFLTAMLAFSDGEYIIKASEQMSRRPMKELIEVLQTAGAVFEFLNDDYKFPFIVKGALYVSKDDRCKSESEYSFSINIDKSSQFLSALLMAAPMLKSKINIRIKGNRQALSYVDITTKMMSDFGVNVIKNSHNYVIEKEQSYSGMDYICEPDVSAACYFYAMAAVTGKTAVVKGVYYKSIQGDIKFLNVLSQMGCKVSETGYGISVSGPKDGILKGIDIDMSDYSDQTMTLAAIAPYADSPVTIRNIGHIRGQETDRISAVNNELVRMGIECNVWEDGITINPGNPIPALIDTYNDHRVAMAFAVTGLRTPGLRINNPECCKKTFPGYFDILDSLTK